MADTTIVATPITTYQQTSLLRAMSLSAGLRWLALFVASLLISGCSGFKQDLYHWALDFERGRADLTEKQLDLAGHKITYLESPRVEGQETLVLIHGFGANKDNWVRFAAALPEQLHLVILDLPGHGDSDKPLDAQYDLDDQVRNVHAFLQALDVKRAHFAGNSMGGAISALYAATYPDQVATASLLDPGGIFEHQSEFNQMVGKGENPLIISKPEDFDYLLSFALSEQPFIPWPVKSVMAEKAAANYEINKVMFAALQGEHEYDFKAAIATIQAPTLILWGDEDRLIDVKNADIFEQLIPGARKKIYTGIGHAPMVEVPDESAQDVYAFIQAALAAPEKATGSSIME